MSTGTFLLSFVLVFFTASKDEVWSYKNAERSPTQLGSASPESCPFASSNALTDLIFTGRFANYTSADTWYPSWASNGHLYSPWTDGRIHGKYDRGTRPECHSSGGKRARTGQARIEGNDPLQLKVFSLGTQTASALPYKGRYPCGSLVHDGIWYYGTYALAAEDYGLNWPIMGPFPGFRISRDYGETWQPTPHTCKPGDALFPEPAEMKGPVKFGAPHFVDFGRNMEHSPDGKAYLVAHGATEKDREDRKANLSWVTGDQVYLCRVVPSPETINDESKYEYFAGRDEQGRPRWSEDFEDTRPLLEWDNNCGCVTMTYNAPLKKYFMCITDGWPTVSSMNTYILESDQLTGPWKMVTYMEDFGPIGYFVNIPSKFISDDGRTFWLCYSANFTHKGRWHDPQYFLNNRPPGSTYAMCLQEVKITLQADQKSSSRLEGIPEEFGSTSN
jgi:hypothetical protein